MKKFISNSINMIRNVLNFLTNNPTPTSGITAFATAKTSADNKLVLIDGLTAIAETTTKGVTLDTKAIRFTMIDIAFKVGQAVAAYAASVGNNTLKAQVDFPKSKLRAMKHDIIDDICQQIHDAGDSNIAAAGPFGYVAGDMLVRFSPVSGEMPKAEGVSPPCHGSPPWHGFSNHPKPQTPPFHGFSNHPKQQTINNKRFFPTSFSI